MTDIILTEEDIKVNIDDEYYFRESNICVLVSHKGKTGEEIKQQILKNQEIVDRLRERNFTIYQDCLKTIEKCQMKYTLDSWDEANLDTIEMVFNYILQSILGENK